MYVVRFTVGSQEFELEAPSFESAEALVQFFANANVRDVCIAKLPQGLGAPLWQ